MCDEFADLNFGTPILGKGRDQESSVVEKEEQSVKTSHHSRFIDDQLLYSTCVTYESKREMPSQSFFQRMHVRVLFSQ